MQHDQQWDIKYPWLRWQLIETIEDVVHLYVQVAIWRSGMGPSWFAAFIESLFDDLSIGVHPYGLVGGVLFDEAEADALQRLATLLGDLVDTGGPEALPASAFPSTADYADLPAGIWTEIFWAASNLRDALIVNGAPGVPSESMPSKHPPAN